MRSPDLRLPLAVHHGLGAAAFVDGRIHLPGGAVTQRGNTSSNLQQLFRPPADCR